MEDKACASEISDHREKESGEMAWRPSCMSDEAATKRSQQTLRRNRRAHIFGGVVSFDTQTSQNHWEILKIHDFS